MRFSLLATACMFLLLNLFVSAEDVKECTGLETEDGVKCAFMAKFRDFSTNPEDPRHYGTFKTPTSFYLPKTPRISTTKIRRYHNWDFEIDFKLCWAKREMCFGDAPPGCTCPPPDSATWVQPQPYHICDGGCSVPQIGVLANRMNNRTDKPVYISKRRVKASIHNKDSFDSWFDTCHGCDPAYTRSGKECSGCGYSFEFRRPLVATYVAGTNGQRGKYTYSNSAFFPIGAGEGWGSQGLTDTQGVAKNYGFTTDLHLQFAYEGGETFKFTGDDDLWVFLDQQLFVDLGGMHTPCSATITLPAKGCMNTNLGCVATVNRPLCYEYLPAISQQIRVDHLIQGRIYDFNLFHAERHSTGSNFAFETSMRLRGDTCQNMLNHLLDGSYPQPGAAILAEPLTDPNIDPDSLRLRGQKQKCLIMTLRTQCSANGCLPGFTRVGPAYLTCNGNTLLLELPKNSVACRPDATTKSSTIATKPTTATDGNGNPVTALVTTPKETVTDGNGNPVTATTKKTDGTAADDDNPATTKKVDTVSTTTAGSLLCVMLLLVGLDV